MNDDTPTERFETPGTNGAGADMSVAPSEQNNSKRLILIFSIVGGLLLIAVVVLLTLLLSGGFGVQKSDPVATTSTRASATPSATLSATPSVSPSASASTPPSSSPAPPPPPPPPPQLGPRFTSLDYPASQHCSAGGPSVPPTRPSFSVSWSTADAVEAWFINGTDDAADSGFMQIPLSGNQADFAFEQTVDCADDSNTYTITLVGADGSHVSESWTVDITGDNF